MIHSLRPFVMVSILCVSIPGSACVINADDDGDAADSSEGGSTASSGNTSTASSSGPGTTASSSGPGTDPGTTASSTDPGTTASSTDPGTTAPGTDDSDTADETQGESGVDVDPQDGEWLYEESGGTTNDCTFVAEPSNGFGEYLLANTGGGAFTITPGDGTDPFVCSHADGSFECDERLSGTYDVGMGLGDATGNILVGIEGTLADAEHMSAEQQGRIECEGADCGTAAGLLGVTFPCSFTIPFTGTAQ
jgi:hypothetical protein